jgi:hypothetical protein
LSRKVFKGKKINYLLVIETYTGDNMWSIKDVREVINEIERKMERGEYERKIEYGAAYEISNKCGEPEVYVITGKSKYEYLLCVYISPDEPRYNLILREYGLEETPYKPGIVFLYRSRIDELAKLKTAEEWDERFALAHELGHHILRRNIRDYILNSNSLKPKRGYETIKSLYNLLGFVFQVRDFLHSSYEVYSKLKKCSEEDPTLSRMIREMENYSEEIYTFSMDTLKDFKTLDESYATATQILTVLEWMRNNEISRNYAVNYLHNQMGMWKESYPYSFALNKIFDRFDENSRIWQLMEGFLKYHKISEVGLVKELEQKREDVLREVEEELYRLPDKAGKKLKEMNKKRAKIEDNLEMLKGVLYLFQ